MDDIGLQRAIYASLAGNGGGGNSRPAPAPRPQPTTSSNMRAGAGSGSASDWGLRRGHSEGNNSNSYQPVGRRNQLEREGILPRGQSSTFQSGRTNASGAVKPQPHGGAFQPSSPTKTNNNNRKSGNSFDEQHSDELHEDQPKKVVASRNFYDRLIAWKELSQGGRSQAQNPQQDHILLVTEETLPDRVSEFGGHEALLIGRDEPIDMRNSVGGKSHVIKMQLKSLTGSGKYSTFTIGFSTKSLCESHQVNGLAASAPPLGFLGVSIHYEFTGAVFITVDEWSVAGGRDANFPGCILYKKMERRITLEKAQQVKPKRDGLEIKIPFNNRSIDVIVNDHLHFKNVMGGGGIGLDGDGDDVFVCLLAAGGRFSAKHLEISDAIVNQGGSSNNSGSSSPPPPMAPRSAGAIAGRRAPSRQVGTSSGVTNARGGGGGAAATSRVGGGGGRASSSPHPHQRNGNVGAHQSGANSRAGSHQQNANHNNNGSNYNPDDPFIQMIEAEIVDRSPNVQWDDIAGVADAKAVLNEAVILPLLVPELFTGVRQPWKGVLLYGPPGTGKTMLAKGVATSAKTTFYSISASTLLSRFHGESEKMVKALFQSARANAPSTIFFDEIDAIMSKRGGANEHEASRRLKAEMLQQIDGVGVNQGVDGRVMLLAATNTPWDLDEAMRRRLEKRIYVPLPDEDGRLDFLKRQTGQQNGSGCAPSSSSSSSPPSSANMAIDPSVNLKEIAHLTDGYSGADMSQLCRDAAMMPMRRLIADKSPQQIAEMKMRGQMMTVPPVSREDFLQALAKVKPSVSKNELGKYEEWTNEFSSI